ncbi:DUF3352 domain-containing protein [Aeromicrobium sp. UC242_57]|uniref:DUF3352 domain-containing protein n=1 Tax=Aeromicrobium sp. UC242_57 TaxID=3374624 RepID=UPI003789B57E
MRELLISDLPGSCDDVDYDSDIKPWLGDRVGVGGSLTDKSFTIAVQTTDEKKSREGIKKLFACGNEDYGIAYLDGYAILSESQATVDKSIKATAKATLGDSAKFTKDFDQLGNQGIASAWADFTALADSPEAKDMFGTELAEFKKADSMAATLRVDDNALELAAISKSGDTEPASTASLAKLPADTVLGLSVAGVGDEVAKNFESAVSEFGTFFGGSSGGSSSGLTADDFDSQEEYESFQELMGDSSTKSPEDFLAEFEKETGFNLRNDLETLFGDSLTVALGSENLETIPNLSGPEGLNAINLALALTSDKTKALDLVERLASLADKAGISLIAGPTDDGAVLATNQDAADSIAKPDGTLGEEEAFKQVIPDGDAAYGGLFINVGTILDKLLEADPPEGIRSQIESAQAVSGVGISASMKDDDRTLIRLRLGLK